MKYEELKPLLKWAFEVAPDVPGTARAVVAFRVLNELEWEGPEYKQAYVLGVSLPVELNTLLTQYRKRRDGERMKLCERWWLENGYLGGVKPCPEKRMMTTLREQIVDIAKRKINVIYPSHVSFGTMVNTLACEAFAQRWPEGPETEAIREAYKILCDSTDYQALDRPRPVTSSGA